jgi:hypothetical protein
MGFGLHELQTFCLARRTAARAYRKSLPDLIVKVHQQFQNIF